MQHSSSEAEQPQAATAAATPGEQPVTPTDSRSADRLYCAVKLPPMPVFADGVSAERAIIVVGAKKRWVNGTVLHYYLFNDPGEGSTIKLSDGTTEWRTWAGELAQQNVVRWAFDQWQSLGIGLQFQEVSSREKAEVRIGFLQGDGSWSCVGREDILAISNSNQRTMNLGWDLTDAYGHDTALHEIGHTLGLMHEHQSPFSGIEWDEDAVYASFGEGTRNNWSRQRIYDNILSKTDPSSVTGSKWDANSVMEYWFDPGLVRKPVPYDKIGIYPAGGLSPLDIAWIRKAYPPIKAAIASLNLAQTEPLNVVNGAQRNFTVTPPDSGLYSVKTSGQGDTVLVLFENDNGALRYVQGDDDSGEKRNAQLQVELERGKQYVLRAKQVYNEDLTKPVKITFEEM